MAVNHQNSSVGSSQVGGFVRVETLKVCCTNVKREQCSLAKVVTSRVERKAIFVIFEERVNSLKNAK
jgi:transposase-like protein